MDGKVAFSLWAINVYLPLSVLLSLSLSPDFQLEKVHSKYNFFFQLRPQTLHCPYKFRLMLTLQLGIAHLDDDK